MHVPINMHVHEYAHIHTNWRYCFVIISIMHALLILCLLLCALASAESLVLLDEIPKRDPVGVTGSKEVYSQFGVDIMVSRLLTVSIRSCCCF